MDVANMISVASGWVPTVMLFGLVLGFFVALGRSASPGAHQPHEPASLFSHIAMRALAGIRRLNELHRRNALPPWDDLDHHLTPRSPGCPT